MNKNETVKILAMISAYYGQGKADPQQMVNAWYVILKDYDYGVAEKAVIEFAKTDSRDYATFPSVGQIVRAIEKQKNYANLIYNTLWAGGDYDSLPVGAQNLLSKAVFDEYKGKGLTEIENSSKAIKNAILQNQQKKLIE